MENITLLRIWKLYFNPKTNVVLFYAFSEARSTCTGEYSHYHSHMNGMFLMSEPISFHKCKICNNLKDNRSAMVGDEATAQCIKQHINY